MHKVIILLFSLLLTSFYFQSESVVENHFEGFDTDNLFILANGNAYVQAEYKYRYNYAYRPKVVMLKNELFFPHMQQSIKVRQTVYKELRVVKYSSASTDTLFLSDGSAAVGNILFTFQGQKVIIYKNYSDQWKITKQSDMDSKDIKIINPQGEYNSRPAISVGGGPSRSRVRSNFSGDSYSIKENTGNNSVIEVSNTTDREVFFAYCFNNLFNDRWESAGWYKVGPRSTATINMKYEYIGKVYLYAESGDITWGSNTDGVRMCVHKTDAFTLYSALSNQCEVYSPEYKTVIPSSLEFATGVVRWTLK